MKEEVQNVEATDEVGNKSIDFGFNPGDIVTDDKKKICVVKKEKPGLLYFEKEFVFEDGNLSEYHKSGIGLKSYKWRKVTYLEKKLLKGILNELTCAVL